MAMQMCMSGTWDAGWWVVWRILEWPIVAAVGKFGCMRFPGWCGGLIAILLTCRDEAAMARAEWSASSYSQFQRLQVSEELKCRVQTEPRISMAMDLLHSSTFILLCLRIRIQLKHRAFEELAQNGLRGGDISEPRRRSGLSYDTYL